VFLSGNYGKVKVSTRTRQVDMDLKIAASTAKHHMHNQDHQPSKILMKIMFYTTGLGVTILITKIVVKY
jgi:hypothetical protein